MANPYPTLPALSASAARTSTNGSSVSKNTELRGFSINPAVADGLFSPPKVAIHLVKMACERPERLGRSLSQWDCVELSRQLIEQGIVSDISSETVRRILSYNKLKPWRHHPWLTPKHPRNEAFYLSITELIELYTRPLLPHEVVLCVDEKTSLQPRPRTHATQPAQPGCIPNRVEHEYKRD
jgi:hypothetical protein